MAAATAIRGKDWVFNAFWAACGESNSPKCSINIPITFIFKSGKPVKTLTTDERTGYVKRVILEDISVDRTADERGLRGENLKNLRAMRKLLIEYSTTNGYDDVQTIEKPFICKVPLTTILSILYLLCLVSRYSTPTDKSRTWQWIVSIMFFAMRGGACRCC